MEKNVVLTVDLLSKEITYQSTENGIPFTAPIRIIFFESDTDYYGQVVIDGVAREFSYVVREKKGILHEPTIKLLARHVNFPTKS